MDAYKFSFDSSNYLIYYEGGQYMETPFLDTESYLKWEWIQESDSRFIPWIPSSQSQSSSSHSQSLPSPQALPPTKSETANQTNAPNT